MRKGYLAAGLIASLAIAAAGYWMWERKQTAHEQASILRLMQGAGDGLRVDMTPGREPATQSGTLRAAAQRVDEDAAALRTLAVDRVPELSVAVAGYLDTARELLKRRARIIELEPRVRQGMAAFRQHMQRRGAADWTGEAVRLKNRLEEDYRDYQRTIETHTRLSEGYAEEYDLLVPLVPADGLATLDEVNAVRDRVVALGNSAHLEMEALRRMTAPPS